MSGFVELDRSFAPVREGEEPVLYTDRHFGRRYHGWLSWNELLERPRCVLLAEAGAGKTSEFEACRAKLEAEGRPAFFLRIEELADEDLPLCLAPADLLRFESWLTGGGVAHFLLDSVDEARLNGKKLYTALRRTARSLSGHLLRAHILLSCRISDWQWQADLAEIKRHLPYQVAAVTDEPDLSPVERWLAALFPTSNADPLKTVETSRRDEEITVVMLAPLGRLERKPLLEHMRVEDIPAFEDAVVRNGLESFADRPGDVIAMATYWNEHGCFGSRREMTDTLM